MTIEEYNLLRDCMVTAIGRLLAEGDYENSAKYNKLLNEITHIVVYKEKE